MSEFVHVQWWDEQAMVHDEIINTRNIEKVYMVLPTRESLRMVERDRDRWLVKEMIGEEAIKLIERSDTEKNALDEVVEMIIDSMNTRFVFLLQLMCHAHRWDCSEMLQAYDHLRRQMEHKEET